MAKYHRVSNQTVEVVQWTGNNFEEVSKFCDQNAWFCVKAENDFCLELRIKHGHGSRIVSPKEYIRFEGGTAVITQPHNFKKMFLLAEKQ